MKIYIATALTLATDEHKALIKKIRDDLNKNHEVLDYFGLKPGDAKDVYEYNKACMEKSDLILAECSEKSLGTGYEIGYGLAIGKKVMCFANTKNTVGRMIRGITDTNFSFIVYDNPDDIVKTLNNL